METEKKNFETSKKTIKPLKIIGIGKSVKTNGFDCFNEPTKPSQQESFTSPKVARKLNSASDTFRNDDLKNDPRLNSFSRNNFNPDMLKAPIPSSQRSAPKPEVTQEMKQSLQENMNFMKNILKLYQVVKGPMKKQTLLLQDYKQDNYHKMVFGYQVETFDSISDEFIKIQVPEGEYITLTLTKENSSAESIKTAWKYLKDEFSEQRSFAFDFQIADPRSKTITFYVSTK